MDSYPIARSSAGYVPTGPRDLHNVYHQRQAAFAEEHGVAGELLEAYNGKLAARWMEYFHEEMHRHVINFLRLAADDLSAMAGQEFPLYFSPTGDKPEHKADAERREAIMYGYNAAGRRCGSIDMKGLMGVLSWWTVVAGKSVAMALPDYNKKVPFFTWRHPLTYYPPPGYGPWSQGELDHVLFAYRITVAEAMRRWPHAGRELRRWYSEKHFGNDYDPIDQRHTILVGEYYCKDAWYVATLEDKTIILVGSEQGLDKSNPGICPVVEMSLFNPSYPRSLLADQISLMAAASRMFSQQIDYFDRTLYSPIFGPPLVGDKFRSGPDAYNTIKQDPSGRPAPPVHQLAPQHSIQADQTLQLTMGLMRVLNRNPAEAQGQTAGSMNSAKAITELMGNVADGVKHIIWRPFMQSLPKLYTKGMQIDVGLWPNDQKRIAGITPEYHRSKRSQRTGATYRARPTLDGFEHDCEIEPGILLRGFEGRLELMQLKDTGLLSVETALEQLDVVRDPHAEKTRIQRGQTETLIQASLEKALAEGTLQPDALFKLREMQEKGMDTFDAMSELSKRGELYVPPPEPMGGPQSDPLMELAAGMEGQVPGGGAPPLELLQGGMAG